MYRSLGNKEQAQKLLHELTESPDIGNFAGVLMIAHQEGVETCWMTTSEEPYIIPQLVNLMIKSAVRTCMADDREDAIREILDILMSHMGTIYNKQYKVYEHDMKITEIQEFTTNPIQ